MKTKSIHQTVTFDATPEVVYELLMNPEQHSAFSGAEATMDSVINGEFSSYDGYCHGHNIELTPGKKIVQETAIIFNNFNELKYWSNIIISDGTCLIITKIKSYCTVS